MANTNEIPVDHLRVSFDTVKPVQFETSIALAEALAAALRSNPAIGDDARIELIEMCQGSWWAQILIIAGGVGSIALGAQGLMREIRAGNTPFAQASAALVAEGDAGSMTIATSDHEETILRAEMPSIAGMVPEANFYGKGPYGGVARGASLDADFVHGKISVEDGLRRYPPDRLAHNGDQLTIGEDKIAFGPGPIIGNGDAEPRWRRSEGEEPSKFTGRFIRSGQDFRFEKDGGSLTLVDEIHAKEAPPTDVTLEITAFLRKGSQGGMADPRLIVIDWRELDQAETSASKPSGVVTLDGHPVPSAARINFSDAAVENANFGTFVGRFRKGPTENDPLVFVDEQSMEVIPAVPAAAFFGDLYSEQLMSVTGYLQPAPNRALLFMDASHPTSLDEVQRV